MAHAVAVQLPQYQLQQLELLDVPFSPSIQRARERAVTSRVANFFVSEGRRISRFLARELRPFLDEDEPGQTDYRPRVRLQGDLSEQRIRSMLGRLGLNQKWYNGLHTAMESNLETAFRSQSTGVFAALGREVPDVLNLEATVFAAERSAELVGMQRLPNGSLVVSPNAANNITDSTRKALRGHITRAVSSGQSTGELAKNIRTSGTFSRARSMRIATYEIGQAYTNGSQAAYNEAEEITHKGWSSVEDDRVRPAHMSLNSSPPIPKGDTWSAGNPPTDPGCRCRIVPYLDREVRPRRPPGGDAETPNNFNTVSSKTPTPPANAIAAADKDTLLTEALTAQARARGLSVQEYREQTNARITSLLREQNVNIQVREDGLAQILQDGRFKSQFETGKSEGSLNVAGRTRFEKDIMGLADDVADSQRPIYGWSGNLELKEAQSTVEAYGEITVQLKHSVRPRSTSTFGDSLNEQLVPSPMNKFDVRSIQKSRGAVDENWLAQPFDDFVTSRTQYAEAQIHGQVRVGDIDRVLINSDTARTRSDLVQALHNKGIRVDEYDTVWDRYQKFGGPEVPIPRQILPGKLRAEGGLP